MVVNLLFPRGCAGCDKPDEVLCEACRALFSQPTAQSFDGVAMHAGSHADGTVARSERRFSRGRITATRNVTVRSPMRYAPLQKCLALLTSFVIGMVHAMMLLWFPRLRLPLQYVVADVNI